MNKFSEKLSLKVSYTSFLVAGIHCTVSSELRDVHIDEYTLRLTSMATITRCDLSARFFCIDSTLLCEFESDKLDMNQRV